MFTIKYNTKRGYLRYRESNSWRWFMKTYLTLICWLGCGPNISRKGPTWPRLSIVWLRSRWYVLWHLIDIGLKEIADQMHSLRVGFLKNNIAISKQTSNSVFYQVVFDFMHISWYLKTFLLHKLFSFYLVGFFLYSSSILIVFWSKIWIVIAKVLFFFYTEQLIQIRWGTAARMLCDIGDSVESIQPLAFKMISDE